MITLKEAPDMLTTREAAEILRRKKNTLRLWAAKGNGPIQPVRLKPGGLLLWRKADILKLIYGESDS